MRALTLQAGVSPAKKDKGDKIVALVSARNGSVSRHAGK